MHIVFFECIPDGVVFLRVGVVGGVVAVVGVGDYGLSVS